MVHRDRDPTSPGSPMEEKSEEERVVVFHFRGFVRGHDGSIVFVPFISYSLYK